MWPSTPTLARIRAQALESGGSSCHWKHVWGCTWVLQIFFQYELHTSKITCNHDLLLLGAHTNHYPQHPSLRRERCARCVSVYRPLAQDSICVGWSKIQYELHVRIHTHIHTTKSMYIFFTWIYTRMYADVRSHMCTHVCMLDASKHPYFFLLVSK